MVEQLIQITESWTPDSDGSKLAGLKVDGEEMPTLKYARLNKLKYLMNEYTKKM